MKKFFFIIAKIAGIDYLTKVEADTLAGAEHMVLDLGITGKHEYAVEACMAFDTDSMKTDTFRYSAIAAEPIDFPKLSRIIEARNAEIKEKEEAEERLVDISKELRSLTERLELLKAEEREILARFN